jgi:hypothetical protein
MIKQSLIAAALGVAVATTPVLAADKAAPQETLVEKLDVKLSGNITMYVEDGSADGVDPQVKGKYSRFGADVKSKGDVYVIGRLWMGVDEQPDGANDISTLYIYGGVGKVGLGEVTFGRQKSLVDGWVNTTDIFTDAGNAAIQKPAKKQNNSVKYTNKMGDFKVGAMAQLQDGATDETVDTYNVALGWKGIAVSYAKDNINDITWYGLGAKHSFGKITLAGTFTVKDSNDNGIGEIVAWDNGTTGVTRGAEVAASFDLTDKHTLMGAYGKTDAANDDGTVTVGSSSAIYKDTKFFTEADYNLATEDYTARAGVSITF